MDEQLWTKLYSIIPAAVCVPLEEWTGLGRLASRRSIAKGQLWVRSGDPVDSIGLCSKGLFRLYYTTPDGSEFNKSFCSQHDFVAPYSALLQGTAACLSIQALMDSEILAIRYADFVSLYDRHPGWNRFGRLIAEQLFLKKELRERELLFLSAEERYRLFQEQFGKAASNIPQYHIASYLGITPVALSRIRRRLNLG
ncbi:Crp/Fnr family transcriptional regulator [Paenibacillus sp. GCM10027627]|uniref:Crp/Fnr family transcriptional regulator n=1 Tax=unclassified Paenibacillus TaxID=185978 RepID=UPI003645687F